MIRNWPCRVLRTPDKAQTRKVLMTPIQAIPSIVVFMALAKQGENAMNPRQIKAVEIASRFKIQEKEGKWIVPSQSKRGNYSVGLNGTPRCTCPDFDSRGVKCKHIWAAEFTIKRKQTENGSEVTRSVRITEKVERTYGQNWPAYNVSVTMVYPPPRWLIHQGISPTPSPG